MKWILRNTRDIFTREVSSADLDPYLPPVLNRNKTFLRMRGGLRKSERAIIGGGKFLARGYLQGPSV
jgi:hypothetical protein